MIICAAIYIPLFWKAIICIWLLLITSGEGHRLLIYNPSSPNHESSQHSPLSFISPVNMELKYPMQTFVVVFRFSQVQKLHLQRLNFKHVPGGLMFTQPSQTSERGMKNQRHTRATTL
ncbi:hypothetical protein BJ875DRAFT_206179 [Amylocarpus encephaloides]|uniref:Uncharacterized protein n=1 Tax=Amylocarpus encephaloides TaxID=45428 RepID=A0A9P7Y9Z2_9HELO|nr:hypothetical protein BJ875DRAFT_206179 [Amylocarpus encephaloides]